MSQETGPDYHVPHLSMLRAVIAGVTLYLLLTIFLIFFEWWKSATMAATAGKPGDKSRSVDGYHG